MLITPKVFGLEKRNCTFWKWQSLSFKTVCVTYKSDKNYGFYRPKHAVRKAKFIHFGLNLLFEEENMYWEIVFRLSKFQFSEYFDFLIPKTFKNRSWMKTKVYLGLIVSDALF